MMTSGMSGGSESLAETSEAFYADEEIRKPAFATAHQDTTAESAPKPVPMGSPPFASDNSLSTGTQSMGTITLDSSPTPVQGVGGNNDSRNKSAASAKFALSQLHGVSLSIQKTLFSRCTPWSEFFDIQSFQRASTGAVMVDRMERNFPYFYLNYLIICLGLGFVAALLNPIVLVVGCSCGLVCALAGQKGDTIRIGDNSFSTKGFQGVVCTISALILFLVAGNVVVTLMFVCILMVAIHAALHKGVSYEVIASKSNAMVNDFGV